MSLRPNALGRLLQERRLALGYSRTRIAEAVGIKAGTIEGWEMGRVAKPPVHDVLRLARFLGLTSAEIEAVVLEEGETPLGPAEPEARGAVPLLEQAVELFGWSEEQAAAALDTTPAVIRQWRSGAKPMRLPELMTVAAMIGLEAARLGGRGARIADLRPRSTHRHERRT
jgi:transcriptional regulator with XRE-family HTH domain